MGGRVLATQAALDAITSMKRIIEGQLVDDVSKLNREGTTLSQPDQWDGPRAQEFRADWQQMHQSLLQAKDAVETLRQQADQITKAIMAAGGFNA